MRKFLLLIVFLLFLSLALKSEVLFKEVDLDNRVIVNDSITTEIQNELGNKYTIEKIITGFEMNIYCVDMGNDSYYLADNQIRLKLENEYLEKVYIFDLDNDSTPEYLFMTGVGSGLRLIKLTYYNPVTNELYADIFFNQNNGIDIVLKKNKLYAFHAYYEFDGQSEEPIGKISFKGGIVIENLPSHINK